MSEEIDQFEQILTESLGDIGEALAPYFAQQLRDVQAIELSGNNTMKYRMTDAHMELLVNAIIESGVQVDCIVLRHHRLTDASINHLSNLWERDDSNVMLYQLDLEGNDIEVLGAETLSAWICRSDCCLQSLNLSNNAIGGQGGMAIAEALKSNINLQRLLLNNTSLDLKACIAVIACLSANTASNLVHIDLGRPVLNALKNEELMDHMTSRVLLSQATQLQVIDLKYCCIGDQGAIYLSQALMYNTVLQSLNLESNNIGVAGAQAIASYLIEKPTTSIQTLRLSFNQISDEGVSAFASALATPNLRLVELTLKSNKINEKGLLSLGTSLYKNNNLQLLTLLGNTFSDHSAKLFGELCRDRLPYVNLWIDIQIYVVDGVHLVAEAR